MHDASEQPTETAGEAVYPGKEAWKNAPDNRYSAEELREMARNWQVELKERVLPETHRAD
jgi:hypothetical protein